MVKLCIWIISYKSCIGISFHFRHNQISQVKIQEADVPVILPHLLSLYPVCSCDTPSLALPLSSMFSFMVRGLLVQVHNQQHVHALFIVTMLRCPYCITTVASLLTSLRKSEGII